MPILGLGTWQLRGNQALESVKKALELGYTHIDTAEAYLNEEEIGQAIKDFPRDKIFITSKVFPEELDYFRVLGSCEQSLSRLATSYLDQYLIHWPNKNINYNEVFKAFKKLYSEGKIKSFGVSNFTVHHIEDALRITNKLRLSLSINQVEFHPFLFQKELLGYCNEKNIKIVAYSPIARGKVFDNIYLKEIGKKYNKSEGQITLRWLVQKGVIAIPKASSEKHLKENIDIFDFKLNEEDIKIIDNLNEYERLIDPLFSEFDD